MDGGDQVAAAALMPSGRVHAAITSAAAVGLQVAGFSLALRYSEPGLMLLGIGALSGLFLTPDLDVDAGSISHAKVRAASGCLGAIWRLYWWPYSKIVPHRHWLSHAPVLSTLLRISYLLFPLLLISVDTWRVLAQSPAFLAWVAGLAISDFFHWLMDALL